MRPVRLPVGWLTESTALFTAENCAELPDAIVAEYPDRVINGPVVASPVGFPDGFPDGVVLVTCVSPSIDFA